MYYKRINPSATFSPFSILFESWVEGTDNRFGDDFDLYSTLADALVDTNSYTYCGGYGSNKVAFGRCGPTGPVNNNEIGADGFSKL